MEKLIAGYRIFKNDVYPKERHRFKSLAQIQRPQVLFITCADSRIDPAMITQSNPGELFHCRVVGNLVPAHGAMAGGVTSAVEYAVAVLGVEHIIVCGHSDCGAMKAFLHPEKLEGLPAVTSWLQHAQSAIEITKAHCHDPESAQCLEMLTKENAILQLQHLRTHPCVAPRARTGSLQLHAWYYDIGSGTVEAFDEDTHAFRPLDAGIEETVKSPVEVVS